MDLSPTLYTYLSLNTVYRKYNRREYRPIRNPLSLTSFKPRTSTPTTPSSNTSDLFSDPLRRPLTLLRTVMDINCLYGTLQDPSTHYVLYYTIWQISASKSAKAK